MWPWEHLVFGYLLYSATVRLTGGGRPGSRATVVLAVATQLPDLVDKPLGWGLAVLPAGRSLAHSLLVFGLLLVVLVRLDRRRGSALALPFSVGYLSHLAGDVIYPLLLGKGLRAGFLLWPLVPVEAAPVDGVVPHVWALWRDYVGVVTSTTGGLLIVAEFAFLLAGLLVWLADGAPGLPRAVPAAGRHR
jgi:hypothetical protein